MRNSVIVAIMGDASLLILLLVELQQQHGVQILVINIKYC